MTILCKAPVDDAGTMLAYIDSGPPPRDIYTTVTWSPSLFNRLLPTAADTLRHSLLETFKRLLPLAPSHNLRVIAINRRDYTGSTPFSDVDIALLFSDDAEDHKLFLRARGLEVARFLVWIIDELCVPRSARNSKAGSSGGIVLLGWSLGSVTTLAFLRHVSSFPKELIQKLEPYLKAFIMYDSGYATLGYPHPSGRYHPARDTSISASERQAAFNAWISSYYVHPYYASSDLSNSRRIENLVLRSVAFGPKSNSAKDMEGKFFKPPSYTNIEPEVFISAFETYPERSEIAFHGTVQPETLYDQLAGALFFRSSNSSAQLDKNKASVQSEYSTPLPDLQVLYVYGTHSPWTTQWCFWALEADIASHREARRPVKLVRVEGGNHFLHWDDPDKFLALLAEKCGSYHDVAE